jgi:SEL1 protein
MKRMPPCTTTSGKVKDKSCKFPFIFKEKEYNECTLDGTKGKGPEWCATSVERDRSYVKGSWGNCDQESCKAIPNDVEGITYAT